MNRGLRGMIMSEDKKKWSITFLQLVCGLLIHGAVCLWGASWFISNMVRDVEGLKKEAAETKSLSIRHDLALQRIDSEGSARFAREALVLAERLKVIETLLRESRESQARIEYKVSK